MGEYSAIDLFAGCGGMTAGLIKAGFNVVAAVEIDKNAAKTYRANYEKLGVKLFEKDIRQVLTMDIYELLDGGILHLLAGCPPCQGFSSIRRLNKNEHVEDERNNLILEYLRFVKELKPLTLMLENVPALEKYDVFQDVVQQIKKMGYFVDIKIVNVASYGVPQNRKRLVMIGSLIKKVRIPDGGDIRATVREFIGDLKSPACSNDKLHKRYPNHTKEVMERICLTPKDGGSRRDLPPEYILECHKKENIGFNDVYGRLRWDAPSSTITGGCLNPSKGRFLHPSEDRCITAREAAMLQTFDKKYVFPAELSLSSLALMIGNALPPLFCYRQSSYIKQELDGYFMTDIFDDSKRSAIMKKVKNRNTAPELFIRGILNELGFKYRLQTKVLQCKPDIVFPSKKKVIFINGCFWHGHDCTRGVVPKTNTEFWLEKMEKNRARDEKNYFEVKEKGWDYLIIWGCQIKKSNRENLILILNDFLLENK